jgi:hypothetical protein
MQSVKFLRRQAPALLAASLGVWASLLIPSRSEAQTPTAVIIPNGYTQFSDANGKPLASGTVFFYTPGTTTPKTTWQDPYQSIVNANPIVLNGSGEALIWGSGIYRQMVYDVNNNLIWDQLTGGYNCVGGGAIPLGANGAIQYNNNGIFGGLPLGTSALYLQGNASGPATWQPVSVAVGNISGLGAGLTTALTLPEDGSGALCGQTGCTLSAATLNSPIIHTPAIDSGSWTNPTLSGGTWNNPTFTGSITGLPGGGGGGAGTFTSIILTGATPVAPSGAVGLGASLGSIVSCQAIFTGTGGPVDPGHLLGNRGCLAVDVSGGTYYIPLF